MAHTSAAIAFASQVTTFLVDESALQARLDDVFSGVSRKDVVVCTSVDGEIAFAAAGPIRESGQSDAPVWPGCLTKLFTATLIEQLITERVLSLDDRASALISGSSTVRRRLDGITVRHLLEHTHGLDDAACVGAPLTPDGFIDSGALVTKCSEFRLNQPGDIYSYSNAGAWIAGTILETWHGRLYKDVVRSRLLDPLRITPESVYGRNPTLTEGGICPATGGALVVSARDLVRFLNSAGVRKEFRSTATVATSVTPLPGWNPFERGVYRGWKFYGDGWFGHNSIASDDSTILVRLHPEECVSVMVASAHHHVNAVAAKLFGKSLPGYSTLRIPRLCSPETIALSSLDVYEGTYRNSAEAYSVVASGPGKIELDTPRGKSFLRLADDNVFLAHKADVSGAKFVQFLGRHGASFCYLWDGRRLYPNIEVRNHV